MSDLSCSICGTPITGVAVGNGDGTGQRFRHRAYDCPQLLKEIADDAEFQRALAQVGLNTLIRSGTRG